MHKDETYGTVRRASRPTEPTGRRARLIDIAVCLLLVGAALAFTSKQVSGHREISPYDEYVYIDYYARVLDDGVVRQGDDTEDFARRYISCHPNRVFGPWEPQLCAAHKPRPDGSYPMGGRTTADLYPPFYFLSLRIMAQPLIWLGTDFVQAGRYAAGVWLALGAILLYGALRRLRVHWIIGFSAVLMMIGSNTAYWANTYISTDGAALASGAAMLLAAVCFAQRRSRAAAFAMIAIATLASLLKIQNLEAVAVASGYLLLMALFDRGQDADGLRLRVRRMLTDRRTVVAIGSLGAGAVAQAAWLATRAALSLGPDPDLAVSKAYDFPFDLARDMLAFLPGVAAGGISGAELGKWSVPAVQILSLVIVAGVLGLALGRGFSSSERALGISVLVASFTAGPALSLATIVMSGSYVPLVLRYGAPMLPAMLACFAVLVPPRSRSVRGVVLALAVALYAMGLSIAQ